MARRPETQHRGHRTVVPAASPRSPPRFCRTGSVLGKAARTGSLNVSALNWLLPNVPCDPAGCAQAARVHAGRSEGGRRRRRLPCPPKSDGKWTNRGSRTRVRGRYVSWEGTKRAFTSKRGAHGTCRQGRDQPSQTSVVSLVAPGTGGFSDKAGGVVNGCDIREAETCHHREDLHPSVTRVS